MARPKLGEGESVRLNMMIQDDMLDDVQAWRYANRVPSLSEAIRLLIQAGMETAKGRGVHNGPEA